MADFARMRAWTDALHRWSEPLSRSFMYVGITRVHQLQLRSAEGGWDDVEREVVESSDALVDSHAWMAGDGYYELGEIRRRRGDPAGAAAAYRRAREVGVDPQPGAALLRAAQGDPTGALDDLRASLGERTTFSGMRLLLPTVEVALSIGRVEEARQHTAELMRLAGQFASDGLVAWSDHAQAHIALDAGRSREALELIERAARIYREHHVRYDLARAHELAGRAKAATGDQPGARAEQATAAAIYGQLGATPDLERVADRPRPAGLTPREVEVLACMATGASNRAIAQSLFISEKTVSRHLANIFAKAGVGTRTAAAAWAREHGLDGRVTA
jgi:DNA-binding NarL/FixJ family response regulator